MLEINEPIVLANSQKVEISGFSMSRDSKGQWFASIRFVIKDENGKYINYKSINIKPEEWNDFWESFNNGRFLYQKAFLELEVPESVESDFENTV